jgi:hypothetical protein
MLSSRTDYGAFEPLFELYLDLHKQLHLADLDDREARGRWKSFVGKWNRGELAEGWYSPEMFEKAAAGFVGKAARQEGKADIDGRSRLAKHESGRDTVQEEGTEEDDDDDDEYGPTLPGSEAGRQQLRSEGPAHSRSGPAIPSLQDLEMRRADDMEAKESHVADIRSARRADRKEQAERLEELVPRAEPGSRERRLEKRREAADANREYRSGAASGAAGMDEVGDQELMDDDDGKADFRRQVAEMQRRKTEREIRREEIARARNAEREERMREYAMKEEKTVDMLRELAKKRFG